MHIDMYLRMALILKILAFVVGSYFFIIGFFGFFAGAGLAGKIDGWERVVSLGYMVFGALFMTPNRLFVKIHWREIYIFSCSIPAASLVLWSYLSRDIPYDKGEGALISIVLFIALLTGPMSALSFHLGVREKGKR